VCVGESGGCVDDGGGGAADFGNGDVGWDDCRVAGGGNHSSNAADCAGVCSCLNSDEPGSRYRRGTVGGVDFAIVKDGWRVSARHSRDWEDWSASLLGSLDVSEARSSAESGSHGVEGCGSSGNQGCGVGNTRHVRDIRLRSCMCRG